MESVCLPKLDKLLSEGPTQPYPYTKTFEEAKHDPCFIAQTSNSSSVPKPVTWTHWMINTAGRQHHVPLDRCPILQASIFDTSKRHYLGWPVFDGAGLGVGLLESCFNNTTVIIGPPFAAEALDDIIEYANIDAASCSSTDLGEIARRPAVLAKLAKLIFIRYLGGIYSSSHVTLDMLTYRRIALNRNTRYNLATYKALPRYGRPRDDTHCLALDGCTRSVRNFIRLKHIGIEMRPVAALCQLVYAKHPMYPEYQSILKAQNLYSRPPSPLSQNIKGVKEANEPNPMVFKCPATTRCLWLRRSGDEWTISHGASVG
jgi:hypothetical protein